MCSREVERDCEESEGKGVNEFERNVIWFLRWIMCILAFIAGTVFAMK